MSRRLIAFVAVLLATSVLAQEESSPRRTLKVFTQSTTANYIVRNATDLSQTDSNIYQNGQRLGVNTTNTWRLLSLDLGSATGDGLRFARSADATSPYMDFLMITGSPTYAYIQVGDSGAYRTLSLNPSGGSVGIGTTAPVSYFHVNGNNSQFMTVQRGTKQMYVNANSGGGDVFSQLGNRASDNMGLSLTSKDTSPQFLYIDPNGKVGMGTMAPQTALDVVSSTYGVGLRVYDSAAVNTGFGAGVELAGKFDTAGTTYTNFAAVKGLKNNVPSGDKVGKLSLQAADATGTLVEVARLAPGSMVVNGILTGTEIRATYQDVAEWVPSREDLAPGTVVVLDEAIGNAVIASTRSYDTTVAGVVSAQPGVILGVGGASKEQIATTGRVRVKVDATAAPIRVGDLLVTSNKPGYAMKSIPVDVSGIAMHRPGTIVGKALEALPTGEGEILVLLSLQ